MRKRLGWTGFSGIGLILAFVAILASVLTAQANAGGPGYSRIEQTENAAVIQYTNQVAEKYAICPELLQAMVFYESSNKMSAKNGKCIGYMQVSTKYHGGRADKLGVSIYDGYGNILTGTDYLVELLEEYDDVAYALDVYNGNSKAKYNHENGIISSYAGKILDLSEKLERHHGK